MASVTQTDVIRDNATLHLSPPNNDNDDALRVFEACLESARQANKQREREAEVRESIRAKEWQDALDRILRKVREAEMERAREAHEAEMERAREAREAEERWATKAQEVEDLARAAYLKAENKTRNELAGVLQKNYKLMAKLKSRNKALLSAKGCHSLRGAIGECVVEHGCSFQADLAILPDLCLASWGEDNGYMNRRPPRAQLWHALVNTDSFQESLARNSQVLSLSDTRAASSDAPGIYGVLPNSPLPQSATITVTVTDFDPAAALAIIGVLGNLDCASVLDVVVDVVSDDNTYRFEDGTLVLCF